MATAKLYQPDSATPFALSRSKVELFMDCPRCFYLDRRLGIARPPGFPFNLNSAVDALLKREFDRYRAQGVAHPMMTGGGIRAVPHDALHLGSWRPGATISAACAPSTRERTWSSSAPSTTCGATWIPAS